MRTGIDRYTASRAWLHRASVTLAVCTVLLIAKGGLVHSAGAGLSVPDWPTTYGQNMFAYPIDKWTGGIVYEHVHRLIGAGVGFLTIVVAVLMWTIESRRWLRVLSAASVAAVIVQGVLGGMTVLMRLPTAVSVSHALLAQSFLIMTMAMAAATARGWVLDGPAADVAAPRRMQRMLFLAFAFTFVQILLGALTRHTYSAPYIPDFPLSNGRVIPEFTSAHVAIHYAHRVGAVILTTLVFAAGIPVLRRRDLAVLRAPAFWSMAIVLIQFSLGATVIWTRQAIVPNTMHVAFGALTFTATFLAWFRSTRWYRFAAPARPVAARIEGARA